MLNLPANFKNDIQGKDTALFPVIYINPKTPLSPADYIYLSTNNITLDFAIGGVNIHCKPLLLNIPSLKESIDIENAGVVDAYNNAKTKKTNDSDKVDAKIVNDVVDELPEQVLAK